jgi:HCOMODA/2-hydroxy-3-carboxy-muconic semialdehyde decarboxylase
MSTLDAVIDDIVAAIAFSRGLAVLDGFGHVSARHPDRPDRFLLLPARSRRSS